MKNGLYLKLALDGMRKNRQLYFPYLLTGAGMVMMFYILYALAQSPLMTTMRGGGTMGAVLLLGSIVLAVFALLFLFVRVPPVAYVAVHELTHALFGLLFGARVSRLRIGGEHGSADVSRPNAVILLAPYFFPLPAAALLLLRGAVSLFVPLAGTVAGSLCAAAVGAAWGFHLCFTINALLQRQTDLDAYGFLFSVVFLALLNALFLFLSLSLLAPVPLADAFAALRMLLRDSYARCVGLGG